MIETKKEWKRAFKGILIFIGSAFVLLSVIAILRPSSDDVEPVSSVQEKKKKREPVYSSKEQYSDVLKFSLIPIIKKDMRIVKNYDSYFGDEEDHKPIHTREWVVQETERMSQQFHLDTSIEIADEISGLATSVLKIQPPKDFSQYDKTQFNLMIKAYSNNLFSKLYFVNARIDFIQSYQNSGLSMSDFLYETNNGEDFTKTQNKHLDDARSYSDVFVDHLKYFSNKYGPRIEDELDSFSYDYPSL